MTFPYCKTCQGLGRVCLGNRITKTIVDIVKCPRCEGGGWEPKPIAGNAREQVKGPAAPIGGGRSQGSPLPTKDFDPEEMEL